MSKKLGSSHMVNKLQRILDKYTNHTYAHDISLKIETRSGEAFFASNDTQPYFIASTTKLYTTALVLQLIDAKKLTLDTTAAAVLGAATMQGLHRYKGKDYSQLITIRQLLSHTSGLADYFEQKQVDGTTIGGKILRNEDMSWSFEDTLHITREKMKPHFAPSTARKAYYSDTNYQLLGRIVEVLLGKSFTEALEENIVKPLGLRSTYMFTENTLARYGEIATLHSLKVPLAIPRAMASFGADGGMVSTAAESMIFLRAFFEGKLFDVQWISQMQDWRRIFFPMQYGLGLMRFQLPRIMTGFRRLPEFIGHSGASGAFIFYSPDVKAYFAGTVNQTTKRDLSFRFMLDCALALR